MEWFKALLRPARLWALGVGLALVGSGIYLLTRYESSHLLVHKLAGLFASELGFAFLIAVIIFAVLEEEATREHSKSVLGYLYGVDPNRKYFDWLEKHILEQRYYRGRTIVTYEFLKRQEESLFVRYTVEYTVTNASRLDDKKYVLRGALDKKPMHTGATPWDDDLGVSQVEIDDEEIPIQSLTIAKGGSDQCQLYEAPPISLSPGKSARIKAIHYLVKHDHDSEVWHGSCPCLGIELRLKWADELNMRFATEAIHPAPEAMKEHLSANKLRVTLNEPFLIHHGIHFKWTTSEVDRQVRPALRKEAWAGPGHN